MQFINEYTILIFDVELSGPNLYKNALVQIGAVLWNIEHNKLENEFLIDINLEEDKQWDVQTVKDFWLSNDELKKNYEKIKNNKGTNIKESIDQFVNFLNYCNTRCNGRMKMGTNRLDIDASWLNMYLCKYNYPPLHLIFGKIDTLVDTNSFHQACALYTHLDVENFNKERKGNYNPNECVLKYYKIHKRPNTIYDHNPLHDA